MIFGIVFAANPPFPSQIIPAKAGILQTFAANGGVSAAGMVSGRIAAQLEAIAIINFCRCCFAVAVGVGGQYPFVYNISGGNIQPIVGVVSCRCR